MIHYSCDLCGARLESEQERFVVKIEVYASADEPAVCDLADGEDVEGEMEQLAEALSSADPDAVEDTTYRGFRFDLCHRCHRRYLSDPLFRAAKKRMGFSQN